MNKLTKKIVELALLEDIPKNDITSERIFNKKDIARGVLYSKGTYIVSGIKLARFIYSTIDKNLKFTSFVKDSDLINKGEKIFEVKGSVLNILKAERTVLNFLGVLFSIASNTNECVELVKDTKVKILDTRKTLPGLRYLSKEAVVHGKGYNHRFSLSDAVLIKENHIEGAGEEGGIKKALSKFKTKNIILEVKNIEELKIALQLGVKRILLDNFTVNMVAEAVKINNRKAELEVSGGINKSNILNYAKTGVDYISIGALTHTINYADISFLIENV